MSVLDASGVINSLGEPLEDEQYFTVPEVIEEIKDEVSKNLLEMAREKGNIKVFEPGEESVRKVRERGKREGKLEELSETDVKVLALAFEKGEEVLTDDYAMQKMCEKMGLGFEPVLFEGI